MPEFLTRSIHFDLRTDTNGDGLTLAGYASVFNSPTRIFERGREFDEQIAPGAFAKTVNNRDRVVLQFEHGQHPVIGSMPLGVITAMREDERGLYVEARLTDNWLIQPVRDAIADGAVDGMSFRFAVEDETWDHSGDVDLRTITEVRLAELGPVVFPAYSDTAVAVRSATAALTEIMPADQPADTAIDDTVADGTRATPDEGTPTETPDDGHRTRTKNQRQAIVAAALRTPGGAP